MSHEPAPPKPRPSTLRRVGCLGCGVVAVLVAAGVGGVVWFFAQADAAPEFYAERLAMPPARLEEATQGLESKIARLKSWPVPTADREAPAPSPPAEVSTTRPVATPTPTPEALRPPPVESVPPPRPDGATGPRWAITLTEDELNAYFATRLASDAPAVGAAGLREPRIVLESGRARIAFRVERPELTGVVSLAVRPAILDARSDAVRLDVTGAQLGRVPLPLATIAEQIPRPTLPSGFQLTWHPTDAGLSVEADWGPALTGARGPKRHVDTLTLEAGRLTVGGYSEPPPRDAAL